MHSGELGVTPFISATPLGQRIHHAIHRRVRAVLDLHSVLRAAGLVRAVPVLCCAARLLPYFLLHMDRY